MEEVTPNVRFDWITMNKDRVDTLEEVQEALEGLVRFLLISEAVHFDQPHPQIEQLAHRLTANIEEIGSLKKSLRRPSLFVVETQFNEDRKCTSG